MIIGPARITAWIRSTGEREFGRDERAGMVTRDRRPADVQAVQYWQDGPGIVSDRGRTDRRVRHAETGHVDGDRPDTPGHQGGAKTLSNCPELMIA
jgi:hypothetical protein